MNGDILAWLQRGPAASGPDWQGELLALQARQALATGFEQFQIALFSSVLGLVSTPVQRKAGAQIDAHHGGGRNIARREVRLQLRTLFGSGYVGNLARGWLRRRCRRYLHKLPAVAALQMITQPVHWAYFRLSISAFHCRRGAQSKHPLCFFFFLFFKGYSRVAQVWLTELQEG